MDTSPDLREQLLDARVARLDGVLITHDHADQLHGMDDLRAFFDGDARWLGHYGFGALDVPTLSGGVGVPWGVRA